MRKEMKRFHLMENIEEAKTHNNIFFLKRLFSKSGCDSSDYWAPEGNKLMRAGL